MESVYYTCLNNDCEKHRNVFVDGDPDHATCERRRLYLEGQEQPARVPMWALVAVPAVIGLGAAAFFLYRSRARSQMRPQKRDLRESQTRQTWSGEHSHPDERRGHAVPPPIV